MEHWDKLAREVVEVVEFPSLRDLQKPPEQNTEQEDWTR